MGVIRWASATDAGLLPPLMRALYAHDMPEAPPPTDRDIAAHLDLLLSPQTPHKLALAFSNDDQPIGLAAIGVFTSVSDTRPDRWRQAELKELFVDPAYRGAGTGALLLAWAEDQLRAAGVHRLDWHVKQGNTRGIAFYEGRGASVVKTRLSMRKSLLN